MCIRDRTRTARLSVGHSGGTAGAGSRNYKVTLPTKWIERLGLGVNNREMELALDGDRIIITPRLTAEEFAENAIKHGHSVYKFSFFDGDRLCSVIYADFTEKQVRADNYTENIVKTAFGRNSTPSWDDFRELLKERCIPGSRSGLNAVSYTHLDVYKRQALRSVTSLRTSSPARIFSAKATWR